MKEVKNSGTNMHDAYFKEVFSDKENVCDLLQSALPELSKNLDFESLKIQNTSYIDKELNSEFTDLVYGTKFGEEQIEIALIFEHKSSEDKYVELQLMSYIQSAWTENIKQKSEVVAVIPIIFHHGTKKLNLSLFEKLKKLPPELRKYQPLFEVETIDTTSLTSEEIVSIFRTAQLKLVMVVMKHIQTSPVKVLEELKRF